MIHMLVDLIWICILIACMHTKLPLVQILCGLQNLSYTHTVYTHTYIHVHTHTHSQYVTFLLIELPWDGPTSECPEYREWCDQKNYFFSPWSKISNEPLGN